MVTPSSGTPEPSQPLAPSIHLPFLSAAACADLACQSARFQKAFGLKVSPVAWPSPIVGWRTGFARAAFFWDSMKSGLSQKPVWPADVDFIATVDRDAWRFDVIGAWKASADATRTVSILTRSRTAGVRTQ